MLQVSNRKCGEFYESREKGNCVKSVKDLPSASYSEWHTLSDAEREIIQKGEVAFFELSSTVGVFSMFYALNKFFSCFSQI